METISNDTLYSTLSTIIQTIAAIYAIVGTFILFQIQSTEQRVSALLIAYVRDNVLGGIPPVIKGFIAGGEFQKVKLPCANPNQELIDVDIKNLRTYKYLVTFTSISSTLIITSSILIISLADQIKNEPWFNYLFFFIVSIFILTISIVAYKIYFTFLNKKIG